MVNNGTRLPGSILVTSGELARTAATDEEGLFVSLELLRWVKLVFLAGSGPGIKDRRSERLPAAPQFAIMTERRWELSESCSWPGIIDARRMVSDGSPLRSSSSVKANMPQLPV